MKESILTREILPVIKGLLLTYALLLLLTLSGTAIAYFTNIDCKFYHSIGAFTIIVSMFAGGFWAARCGMDKGWLKGIMVGITAALIMFLISLIEVIDIKELISKGIYFVIAAGIGGICGIK